MTERSKIPSGSSFDISGKVSSVVSDTTQMLSNAYDSATTWATDTYNNLVGNETVPNDVTSANVPTEAGDQVISNESRVEPRDPNPLANLLFTVNGPRAINDMRNERHQAILEENKFAVRLKSTANDDIVVFRVPPDINEARTAGYKTLDPIHMPGAVQVYQNTAPRTWNLSGVKLISRNGEEAEENLATVNQLRSWMMPFFGATNTAGVDGYTPDLLGAPPEILEFTAYSAQGSQGITNIRKIPTVMTTMNLNYPTDVDYIATAQTKQPFPAVATVDIILVETHSPRQLSEFDLIKYRHGELEGF